MRFSVAMPRPPIQSFTSVQADPASARGQFTKGLLNPAAPVPASVKGGAVRRYGVYRNNVTVGLTRAMEANFPVVRRLLGEEYFEGFAREFVQSHPPRSPLMFEYGAEFGAALEAADDLAQFPYLGDVARLEQHVRISHHEADAPCLAPTFLAQVPEKQLMDTVFAPHPAMAVLESQYAIHSIYRANRGATPATVENVTVPETVLITRPVLDVQLHLLHGVQSVFFELLSDGNPLGASADAAFAVDENFDLTSAISLMLSSGAFQPPSHKKA
jgi:hypothetical protein